MPEHSPSPENARQLSPSPSAAIPEISRDNPIENWERYQIIALVGQGGMGRVYKAFDPRLKRYVALKFLTREDREQQLRFMNEAQAQARIQHDHVVEIYEVGEVQGHAYIAMQYIEGRPLGELRNELTLEHKVKIIKEVAEALHEAHRAGLIHRDIKPANILIEKREGGLYHPYVMDFGLVRMPQQEGLTLTGVTIGTPAYMSPEQARGQLHGLDRRSDIYSLGVTLYELLTGQVPYHGETGINLILKILDSDPVPIRNVDATVPHDLETIVLKCLEKEPQRRFDSARALSEDLQRYLDGEPILARPTGRGYRLLKRVQKHKSIFALLAISLLIILALSSIAIRARISAASRARLAQQFGQEVEKMESIMRYAYLLPLHDVRPEKKLVIQRISAIEREVKNLGFPAEGPGAYALGRGYLSLHEYVKARHHLERAWNLDYRTPELAYALGQTLGALYRLELDEAERLTGSELREARKRQAEKEFRLAALNYLSRSKGAQTESTDYAEGLIAFYQKHYENALLRAHKAFEQVPWLYEAKLLEGQIYTAMANESRDSGMNAAAIQLYDRAAAALREALKKGRSDALVYECLCGLHSEIMIMQIYQTGASLESNFRDGLNNCDFALLADPESGEAQNKRSALFWRWGEYEFNHGKDPRTSLNNSIEAAMAGIRLNPVNVSAYSNAAYAYRIRAEYEMEHGNDPGLWLNEAVEGFQRIIGIDRNFLQAYANLGNVYWTKGEYELSRGLDPRASLDLAAQNYQRALQLAPNYAMVHQNKGVVFWTKAEYEFEFGFNPQRSIDAAQDSLASAIRLNPNYALTYFNLGGVLKALGDFRETQGEDPLPFYKQSIAQYEKAIQINPNYAWAFSSLALVYFAQAEHQMETGTPFEDSMVLASTNIRKALQMNPDYDEPHLVQGYIAILSGRAKMERGISPLSDFKTAQKAYEEAWKLNPENPPVGRSFAELHRWKSEWLMAAGKNANEEIRVGLAWIGKTLAISDMPQLLAVQGKLYLLQARSDGSKQSAEKAVDSLRRALQANRNLTQKYNPDLQQALAMMQKQ